ncbi:hypothetical protein MVEN_00261900 [Mycena venus]|uniref:Uncharacterized protein n=1 Tax=Mycena venus TaxID=2733690 RepID=A0A8H6Z3T0_9AGAR|nr:hypothetical protein MVEN_00261900 [Mycena venus]
MGPPHSFITSPLTASTRAINLFVLLLCTLLLLPSAVNGAITNTTIDDADSSHFTFTGGWTAVSPSSPCDFCSSKPDASQTFGGTWHDGNYRTGASETTTGSFTFTGSAVYIFGIDQAQSQPDIAFTLGSTQSVHHYTGTEQFVYNALFFSATGLAADQQHTVNWIFNIDQTTGVGVQAALFDYAIVTSGTEDLAPAPNPQTGLSPPPLPPPPHRHLRAKPQTRRVYLFLSLPTVCLTCNQNPKPLFPVSTLILLAAAGILTFFSSSSSSSKSIPNGQQLAGDQSSSSGTAIASQPKASSSTSTAPERQFFSVRLSTSPGVSSGAITSPAPDPAPAPDPDPNPESATSAPHHPSNLGAILGAVLGALALAVLALVVFLLCRHRRRLRAREDDERRAAGLPPAPPGMRRVRGRPVLQPYFVEERPPAPDVAGNVFVTGGVCDGVECQCRRRNGHGHGHGHAPRRDRRGARVHGHWHWGAAGPIPR